MELPGQPLLIKLAELAAVLAGFASVVVGLRSRSHTDPDAFRFMAMLATSLSAAFLSLLPIGLFFAVAPSSDIEWVWRISRYIMAFSLVAGIIIFTAISFKFTLNVFIF